MWIKTEAEHSQTTGITSWLTPRSERRLHSPSLLSLFSLGSSSSDFILLLLLSYLSDRYTLYAYVPAR